LPPAPAPARRPRGVGGAKARARGGGWQRFRNMPSNSGAVLLPSAGGAGAGAEAPNSWWYSWDAGLVHFVALSTEARPPPRPAARWGGAGAEGRRAVQVFFFPQAPEEVERMVAWLDADLARANQRRAAAPWVVVFAHRPLYCSAKEKNCALEPPRVRARLAPLLQAHGVDLYLCGHSHVYERMYDVAPGNRSDAPGYDAGVSTERTEDMPATTFIVDGVAGPDSPSDFALKPLPRTAFAPRPALRRAARGGASSALRRAGRVRVAKHFGYGRATVANATHLLWEQARLPPGPQRRAAPRGADAGARGRWSAARTVGAWRSTGSGWCSTTTGPGSGRSRRGAPSLCRPASSPSWEAARSLLRVPR